MTKKSFDSITFTNVRVHNLKCVSLNIPKNALICFSGVSGSGKSSMAFDTLYVEGQRRYVESLSPNARRIIGELTKPDFEQASGITPTISVEQKSVGRNPRSTVGTVTEIYDYMRIFYARAGTAYCPVSLEPVQAQSREEILEEIQKKFPSKTRLLLLAPYIKNKKGELHDDIEAIRKKGFSRLRIDGKIVHIEDSIELDKGHSHDLDIVVDRIEMQESNHKRLLESLFYALELGNGTVMLVEADTEQEHLFSIYAYSPKSGLSYPPLEPQDFSFNSPSGMCPDCHGLGIRQQFDVQKVIDPEKSIAEDCCSIAGSFQTVRWGNIYRNIANLYNFSLTTPWKHLHSRAQKIFLHGTEKKWTRMTFIHPETGARWIDNVQFRGVLNDAYMRYQEAKSEKYKREFEKFMIEGVCSTCLGERLKAYPRVTLLNGKRIGELTQYTIKDLLEFFKEYKPTPEKKILTSELLKEIKERLSFLLNVGLDYLTLDRTLPTLSGGEAQRVRLASHIGSGLVGVTYVLDEPSIGLHPQDNKKLIATLKTLRDKGNTVVVVEHDEETIRSSDYIVDFGPKAGHLGGEIIFSGTIDNFLKTKNSLTSDYITKKKTIAIPQERRTGSGNSLTLKRATHRNLKNVTLNIPLGKFIAVTGLSGSGKSSLFIETLHNALSNLLMKSTLHAGEYKEIIGLDLIDKVIEIDQSPIGRTPRSNPSTYVKVFDDIRNLFAKLPESKFRGFTAGRFSFNVKEGTCAECHGMGMIKVDMDFLEDSWVDCPQCHGKRFDQETLDIRYKGKTIQDILEMEVRTALEHFQDIPEIYRKLSTLVKIGLDYVHLGQSSTTLSGGEAQRIKLAKELCRKDTGNTLYILDEPTCGLHFHDINFLIKVLQELVDRGNTVIVIEHNMDLVKTADWIIEMGPGSGEKGGKIIFEGTPEELCQTSHPTAQALYEAMNDTIPKVQNKKNSTRDLITSIEVKQAEQNTLKKISAIIPHSALTVCVGPSGSGKSSFAFDTIFSEGQRRYVESLSPYIRQFVKQMPKPKVEQITGLLPACALEQRVSAFNPRSTVGTMTEIYDYLRILYARLGIAHCPKTGAKITAISKEHVTDKILQMPEGAKIHILAPIDIRKNDLFYQFIQKKKNEGYVRIRLNSTYYSLDDIDSIPFDQKRKNALFLVVDRLKIDPTIRLRLLESIRVCAREGKNKLVIHKEHKDIQEDIFYNLDFCVEETGESYPEITPHTFSFNSKEGMCPECLGLGFQWGLDLDRIPAVFTKSAAGLIKQFLPDKSLFLFEYFLESQNIDPSTPLKNLSQQEISYILNGSSTVCEIEHDGTTIHFTWKGLTYALSFYLNHQTLNSDEERPEIAEEWEEALCEVKCHACHGSRISLLARHVTIENLSIADFTKLPIAEAVPFIEKVTPPKDDRTLEQVHNEIRSRLSYLNNIGLSYLSLDRMASTLSGGEAQRTRLARQIGSGLTNVLYVLDEPTIGLHPYDAKKLFGAIDRLKTLGNTLLVVEHDPDFIKTADHIIEFGPGSGQYGGEIITATTLDEYAKSNRPLAQKIFKKTSLTFTAKKKKKTSIPSLTIQQASVHNLKSISCTIPVNQFTCITGVSGSGKSTLLHDVIRHGMGLALIRKKEAISLENFSLTGCDAFHNILVLDQKPIGRTNRSDVATFADLFKHMRYFYAELPEARTHGLEPKHFSTYHRKGMCTHCFGLGYKKVEMYFLPAVKVPCPKCQGLRLNPLSLSVKYKEKSIGEMLQLSINEVVTIFSEHPALSRILGALQRVGLGYLKLGQEMQTLSNGEVQRARLAREIAKRRVGKILFLFDEPTTGLFFSETQCIVDIIKDLIQKGHTVVAVEHNLDFIIHADHIIDLGPDAGASGGEIVAEGALSDIIKVKASKTAKALNEIIG